MDIGVYLATFYRLRGATDQGLQLMHSLASVCTSLSATRTKAFFYLAFASLLCSSGDDDLAGEMLKYAKTHAIRPV